MVKQAKKNFQVKNTLGIISKKGKITKEVILLYQILKNIVTET